MKYALELGMKYLNTPYIWGGENALHGGVDCSGLVLELLRTEGVVGEDDYTAQDLREFLLAHGGTLVTGRKPCAGDIVFFGHPDRATHVAFMLNELQMLEAGGGNSHTTTPAAAANMNAMVRIRPYTRRADLICFVRPSYKVLDV
jgi:cell wall-associated NlpC family hydrolase